MWGENKSWEAEPAGNQFESIFKLSSIKDTDEQDPFSLPIAGWLTTPLLVGDTSLVEFGVMVCSGLY